MLHRTRYNTHLMCGAAAVAMSAMAGAAHADEKRDFNIQAQPLAAALMEFGAQSGVAVVVPGQLTLSKTTRGVTASMEPEVALQTVLAGTGLTYRREGELFAIVQEGEAGSPQSASAVGDGAEGTVEALIVTAQKREEDIQDVPIAISAFTQEDLERSQVAGGPDLMTQVPNFTFTKTNFSSYSIQIRGIGTQAISATTDPAVAIAFNNTPFVRNRFFEQEFYDLQRVEVLRGPQGTLYGRNATAGVVNVISNKPAFAYRAKLSADVANYSSTRVEGMINVPLVDDMVALRMAGAWTKRQGYSTNQITGNQIDGRDLWSTRVSLRFAPTDDLDVNLIWEHFEEDDDRLRSGKQLCHRDARTQLGEGSDGGVLTYTYGGYGSGTSGGLVNQGCLPSSLYAPEAFEAPNGFSLPFYHPLGAIFLPTVADFDPYVSTTQSRDLRIIESTVDPRYTASTDVVELQLGYDFGNGLSLTSETAYLSDELFSTQDYNRFNTAPGAFDVNRLDARWRENLLDENGTFCDPQIGCANRLVAVDLSTARSRQFSQEFRLGSDFDGPFNFSLGANFLRYDTEDKYYVFINTLTLYAAISPYGRGINLPPWEAGVSDNRECLEMGLIEPDPDGVQPVAGCEYIDPNPISSLNDMGHNYFLSRNPYKLISYAAFGEAYYNVTDRLKLTAGLRWTVDKKEAPRIPSWVLGANTVGYPVAEVIEQEWREPTGRLTMDWKPELGFTDETLLYASYAHGYKAGGANPPAAGVVSYANEDTAGGLIAQSATQPKTFDAEFIDAYEIGAKNTLLDGRLTLNASAFYYDYQGYQISYIVNRAAVNLNFDAEVSGLELEADWRPIEQLRFGLKLGYEDTRVADGERAIDVMDRTAGNPNWFVMRPFPTFPSNCILPLNTVDSAYAGFPGQLIMPGNSNVNGNVGMCEHAYVHNLDPVTQMPYVAFPTQIAPLGPGSTPVPVDLHGYSGFNPLDESQGHNHGEGFFKDLSGNELPNAPHYTATLTADYTIPLLNDWLATLHTDLYYQSEAWTRIFNVEGYDKLKAYTNVNLTAIFTNEDAGWKVMAYVKNVFDRDSITGAFLNSDDSGLTTNVFLTEPRLYGLRVTKDWNGGPWWTGANPGHTGPYPLTVEIGGQLQSHDAPYSTFGPGFMETFSEGLNTTGDLENRDLDWGDGREVRLRWRPQNGPWGVSAGIRYGRANGGTGRAHAEELTERVCAATGKYAVLCDPEFYDGAYYDAFNMQKTNFSDISVNNREEYSIVDFGVGRDVGLGGLSALKSSVGVGLRYAQFESTTDLEMRGIPDWYLTPDGVFKYPSHYNVYTADIEGRREFEGVGPVLSWDAAQTLLGDDKGHLDLDWSIAAGVLFGKQDTSLEGRERSIYYTGTLKYPGPQRDDPMVTSPPFEPRSKSVSAPLLDARVGLSYEVQRVRIGAGYRWERYFDVLDTGHDERVSTDRTIDGPYFKLAIGFGG